MTLQEWLNQGEAKLRAGPHPERARRDAELLLMHASKRSRAGLIARREEELAGDAAQVYIETIDRRTAGEPVQYILGEAEFYGLPFRVTPDVLIPRPETEHLVEKAIALAPLFERPRIVDVGTGSGAIAVALAHEWPTASITAIDQSAAALEVARGNAERMGFTSRIRFLQGDLLVPVRQEQFDIVVSNPPYVPAVDRAALAVEVREHEPGLALFAGEDGLDLIRRLVPEAFAVLAPGGALLVEFGFGQWPAVSALFTDAGFAQVESVADLQGIPRVAVGRRG